MNEPVIHICWRNISKRKVEKQHCPTCESEQEFYCEFEEWYGWTVTCLNCGDRWMDGELCPRPFARAWRKESVEYARNQATQHGVHWTAAEPTHPQIVSPGSGSRKSRRQ
jgi:hypothetical protein